MAMNDAYVYPWKERAIFQFKDDLQSQKKDELSEQSVNISNFELGICRIKVYSVTST
jgi:hypothetical protein